MNSIWFGLVAMSITTLVLIAIGVIVYTITAVFHPVVSISILFFLGGSALFAFTHYLAQYIRQ
jgi:hypothetical protein